MNDVGGKLIRGVLMARGAAIVALANGEKDTGDVRWDCLPQAVQDFYRDAASLLARAGVTFPK